MTAPEPIWLDDSSDVSPAVAALVQTGTAVVTGNFDGVHRGHQALFERARVEADARGLVPVVLTFDPHPRFVLGSAPPPLLTSTARRVELITRLGMAYLIIRRFDLAFAGWTAERFVETLLVRTLSAKVVIAGDNFRFGAKRAGDDALLRALGARLGFEAFTLEAVDEKGALSSSRAREAINAGDLDGAANVLGRPHSIEGIVVAGERRGRTLGFPTANLDEVRELVPPNGVYAVTVDRASPEGSRDRTLARALATGVMNIGVRPTVSGDARRSLEAHLFDFDEDLYGQRLRVQFIARLRDERRFDGLDALRAQIARDVEAARAATRGLRPDPARGSYA